MQHPFTGVSSIGLDLDSVVDACRAYEPLLREGEAFSHQTAAMLYGVPLPRHHESPRPLHVVGTGTTRARTAGVVGHRSADDVPVHLRLGFPVVAPETVWFQLASAVGTADLVAAGDFLVSGKVHGPARERAHTTIDRLAAALEQNRGCRGAKAARRALALIRVGAASRPETLLRLLIVASGLPEPAIGPPVPVADGALLLHPDLAYVDLQIAIEYEGAGHRDAGRWERDIARRELFEDAGWRVIRVTRRSLFEEPDSLIERIRRARVARS